MRTSDSIAKISAALLKAQQKMGNAVKDSANPFFRSKYADLNAIREVILPAFNSEGIAVIQPPAFIDGKNFIETILIHDSGEFMASLNEVIVAKQNDPQAFLAAQTYTRRGAMQAFANVGAEDDDGNIAAGRTNQSVRSEVAAKKEEPVKVVVPESNMTEEKKAADAPRRSFRRNSANGVANNEVL